MDRRLAAILVADAAGFSALVGADEDGTIRAWKGHLAALEPVIALPGGRIVKTMGDGFLAEFSSVVDAVSAAALMQARMAERNTGIPAGRRIELRMGIHVGDVVVDGDDILGDGVNIAARLQTLASPGGLAVSGRVFDDVAGRLELTFEELGPQEFKNIARPVPVYALAAHAPALRGSIREVRSITPLDLEQAWGLSEGDLNHGQLILDQALFMRPMPGWSDHRTPVDGLYLCGSGVHGGGGVSGAAGRNAAQAVLKSAASARS